MIAISRLHVHVAETNDPGAGQREACAKNPGTNYDDWKVVKDVYGNPHDFNRKAAGKYVYLYYYLCGVDKEAPIIQLRLRQVPNGPPPAPGKGWSAVTSSSTQPDDAKPGDFNRGTRAESPDIYLYYRKGLKVEAHLNGEPIVELLAGYSDASGDAGLGRALGDFPQDYIVLRQNLNEGTGGSHIFLGYRYATPAP